MAPALCALFRLRLFAKTGTGLNWYFVFLINRFGTAKLKNHRLTGGVERRRESGKT